MSNYRRDRRTSHPLGVKAGSTHLRATIDSDSKLRIEQPGSKPIGVAAKRVFSIVYVDGRVLITDCAACQPQMPSPASSSERDELACSLVGDRVEWMAMRINQLRKAA